MRTRNWNDFSPLNCQIFSAALNENSPIWKNKVCANCVNCIQLRILCNYAMHSVVASPFRNWDSWAVCYHPVDLSTCLVLLQGMCFATKMGLTVIWCRNILHKSQKPQWGRGRDAPGFILKTSHRGNLFDRMSWLNQEQVILRVFIASLVYINWQPGNRLGEINQAGRKMGEGRERGKNERAFFPIDLSNY